MNYYCDEWNIQILLALMKKHGIRRVIASPGSANMRLVASLQNDGDFELYSSVDERSAAYMACGLAAETNEAVALTCTGATASRNYMPGLTEAFYRKLPILAITPTADRTKIGSNHPQMVDRSILPKDLVKKSVHIPPIKSDKQRMAYSSMINDALLELFRRGGGPVHIELETGYENSFTTKTLPNIPMIRRITTRDGFPELPMGSIAIRIGAHLRWDKALTDVVDTFCEKYNAVVLKDHIGNYHGQYGVQSSIVTSQCYGEFECCKIDTLIYIGDISSSYRKRLSVKNVWRVNPDGEIRTEFGPVRFVFEMSECEFFHHYASTPEVHKCNTAYYLTWKNECEKLWKAVPKLPFSNLWVAQHTGPRLPRDSRLFLGIENSLRSWDYFDIDETITAFSNTGGFGIDGGVSSLIGASLAHQDQLYFGITGDLAFFYDMNVLGNRHVGKNVRLMVINNGIGQQFRNPGYAIDSVGEDVNPYIAAAGHYGNKSRTLLKHYAEDLGYRYLSACTKEEYFKQIDAFVDPQIGDRPILFEVFTDTKDESLALKTITTIVNNNHSKAIEQTKKLLGPKGTKFVKGLIKKH